MRGGINIPDAYKMKWRQIGPGRVQLRLLIAIMHGNAYMCESYVKSNDNVDKRYMARMKIRIRDIALGQYQKRGIL